MSLRNPELCLFSYRYSEIIFQMTVISLMCIAGCSEHNVFARCVTMGGRYKYSGSNLPVPLVKGTSNKQSCFGINP